MNTAVCDESTAKFMSEALMSHAREVARYAKTFPGVFESLPEEKARKTVARYIKSVSRMLNELNALLLMARYKGVSRYCNQEQIEAHMESAEEMLESVVQRHREAGHAIDAMPALLN